jgi:type II secretory pathway component PulM
MLGIKMRIFLALGALICLLLSSCQLLTPDTSNAFSQSQQIEELQQQTRHMERQADALEKLVDVVTTNADTVEDSGQSSTGTRQQ